jgi:hypothetical protein
VGWRGVLTDGDARERQTVDDGNNNMDTQRTTGGRGNGGTIIQGRDDGDNDDNDEDEGEGMGTGT